MPESPELVLFTPEDQQSDAYRICVLGQTVIGAAMGSLAGGQTFLGAGIGLVTAKLTCRLLAEPIRRKLFEGQRLTDAEFRQALRAVQKERPGLRKQDALNYLASIWMSGHKRSC